MRNSPDSPRATVRSLTGSTILISVCGMAWPTVSQRCSRVSSGRTMVDAGDVSVMPKAIVISSMPISEPTRRMTSIGHGEPAMIPVRRLDRSNSEKRGWSSSAMNIVGTP